jgi:1,4-alpha-glucan branching enzyme
MAIRNTARMGWFSSDRTIRQYAEDDLEVAGLRSRASIGVGQAGWPPDWTHRSHRRGAPCRSLRKAMLGLHGSFAGTAASSRAAFVPAKTRRGLHREGAPLGELTRRHPPGFFEGKVRSASASRCAITPPMPAANGTCRSLCFGPVLGPMDDYYIGEGTHLRLFDKLGAHPIEHEGAAACISPSGRPMPARLGGRRFQRLGRPPPCDAASASTPASGKSSSRHRAGQAYKFEIVGPPTARSCR